MIFSFDVSAPTPHQPPQPVPTDVPADMLELLRQILEVQKEQYALTRAVAIANDPGHRWRQFLARWNNDYPGVANDCKTVLPQIERAYMDLMRDLTEKLTDDADAIDNEFTLGEFLDRYGMKLNQLGTILNMVTPLAENAPPPPQPAATGDASSEEGA